VERKVDHHEASLEAVLLHFHERNWEPPDLDMAVSIDQIPRRSTWPSGMTVEACEREPAREWRALALIDKVDEASMSFSKISMRFSSGSETDFASKS
jgi:hypothetical protein